MTDHSVIVIEVGNSRLAIERKYDFLPITRVEFEFGGGVCCIQSGSLKQQPAIVAIASQPEKSM
jgi:hypothetical protein